MDDQITRNCPKCTALFHSKMKKLPSLVPLHEPKHELFMIDRFDYVVRPFVVFGWGVGRAPKKQKLNDPSNSGFLVQHN